ncbi:MAG: hypothetical protein D6681_22490, partial [Calditrichaeota bacterium]
MQKMQYYLGMVAGVVVGLLIVPIQGQTLVGTWINHDYNMRMELRQDGTFLFTSPYGNSNGSYMVQGNYLMMYASNGATTPYGITYFDGNRLQLVDANGGVMNFVREAGASPQTPGMDRQMPGAAPPGASEVLLTTGGYQLTRADVQTGVEIVEFIIGQHIQPSEVEELTQAAIQEFPQAPAQFLQQVNSLRQSLQTLHSLTDPVKIGLARQELITAFHKGTRQIPEEQKPMIIRIINRYVKVLAFDPANNLTLTNRDVEGFLNYYRFVSELNGQPFAITPEVQQQAEQAVAQAFPTLPLEQKQVLSSASLIWQVIETNWQRFTPQQQAQFRASFTQQVPQPYGQTGYPQQNYGGGNTSTDVSKQIRDMQADMWYQQNMWNMMQNMNLNSHATA